MNPLVSSSPVLLTLLLLGPALHAKQAEAPSPAEPTWVVLRADRLEAESGARFERLEDGSYLVSGPIAPKDLYTFECVVTERAITGFRIESLPDPSMPKGGSGRAGNGNFVLSLLTLEAGAKRAKKLRPVALKNPSADYSQDVKHVSGLVDGHRSTGWSIFPQVSKPHVAVVETGQDVDYKTGARLRFKLDFQFGGEHVMGRFRLALTSSERPLRAPGSEQEASWSEKQLKVNAAIAEGVSWLLDQQEIDGSWRFHQNGYRTGQTALAVYTLLKSGVPADHPVLRRAVKFLRTHRSVKTYSMGCHIMALCLLNDPADRDRLEEMVAELCSWQKGGFAYPDSAVDLSNTQYAALALRAAVDKGIKVPDKVWVRMADLTLKHQEQVTNPYDPAGFRYRPDQTATGSMTAAGVTILAICAERFKRSRSDVSLAKEQGLKWLAEHFSVRTNPDPKKARTERWLHYYLYGLERVGGLLGIDRFGDHVWYPEGAGYLLEDQNGDGSWSTAYGENQPNTCFALLFLNRATAASTGARAVGQKSYGTDDPATPVSLRASGDSPLAIWISSFGDSVMREHTWYDEEDLGPRVRKVEYWMVGRREVDEPLLIATVQGDPRRPAQNERFPVEFTFKRPGVYEVHAAVYLQPEPFDESEKAAELESVVVESKSLEVQITAAPDPMLYRYAGDAGDNLVNATRVRAVASSELHADWAASLVTDNLLSRGWCSADNDADPSLVLDFEQPIRADTLLLSHVRTKDKARAGRIRRIRVEINRKLTFELDMLPDDERKTEHRLNKPVKINRIAFLVTEVAGAAGDKKGVGLAEVELQLKGRKK